MAVVIGWCVAMQGVLLVMFVWSPRFYWGCLGQTLGLTQHAGMAMNIADHRLNTRTVYINPVFAFLYMNMHYHIEHHLLPMVPYHALPRLHAQLRAQLPPPYRSLWAAYREMVPTLIRQRRDRS